MIFLAQRILETRILAKKTWNFNL